MSQSCPVPERDYVGKQEPANPCISEVKLLDPDGKGKASHGYRGTG